MKVELPYEAVESIVVQEMRFHLDCFRQKQKVPHFSYDPKEERKKVKNLRRAFRTVLEYYGAKP